MKLNNLIDVLHLILIAIDLSLGIMFKFKVKGKWWVQWMGGIFIFYLLCCLVLLQNYKIPFLLPFFHFSKKWNIDSHVSSIYEQIQAQWVRQREKYRNKKFLLSCCLFLPKKMIFWQRYVRTSSVFFQLLTPPPLPLFSTKQAKPASKVANNKYSSKVNELQKDNCNWYKLAHECLLPIERFYIILWT